MKRTFVAALFCALITMAFAGTCFAADPGHGGHVDPDVIGDLVLVFADGSNVTSADVVVSSYDVSSSDLSELSLLLPAGSTLEEGMLGSVSADISGTEDNFLVLVFQGRFDYVVYRGTDGQWHAATGSDGTFTIGEAAPSAAGTVTGAVATVPANETFVKIYDDSDADFSTTPGAIKADLAAGNVEAAAGSGGGGCSAAGLIPMAGLLILPLLTVLKK